VGPRNHILDGVQIPRDHLSAANGISIGSSVFVQPKAQRPTPYTLQWATLPPLKIAALHGGSGPHLIMISCTYKSPQSKWHLDRFSRFCRAHYRDRQTDRPHYSVGSNRPHLCM